MNRYFLMMNKKDVLGARPDAGNVQKMESIPHPIQCWKSSKYGTQQGGNGGKFWRCCCYLIKYQQAKTKAKKF